MPASQATPMMAQYLAIKAEHPDALLFYRMGDFYEMFFDDAVAGAAALDIALTKRGQHEGADIAMAGVPVHSADAYLATLIRKGFRVAVAEQTETPEEAKKRSGKTLVAREVVRVVTPGTLTEDALLDARRGNFLAAHADLRGEGALAWADMSTGAVRLAPCPASALGPMLARVAPAELLLPDDSPLEAAARDLGVPVQPLAPGAFDSVAGTDRITRVYGIASLDAFGEVTRPEIAALSALLNYLELTQKGRLPLLRPPIREGEASHVTLDAATRRSLELTRAQDGGRRGSLLDTVDRTLTPMGARLLERRLSAPSRDGDVLRRRHAAVAAMVEDVPARQALRGAMRKVGDLDRALSRLSLDRAGPRDLGTLRDTLAAACDMAGSLGHAEGVLAEAARHLACHEALLDALEAALVAEPPVQLSTGGMVAPGFDPALDEARALRDDGRSAIAVLQGRYVAATGVTGLKVKHNNVLGYFVEVTSAHEATLRGDDAFIHRQSTASQARFTTPELSELQSRILGAADAAQARERAVFGSLREAVLAAHAPLGDLSRALATIDLTCAFADLASARDWTRPTLTEGRELHIEAGRHPVVEAALVRSNSSFVPNDCDLSDAPIRLLTGPNMAGKSTYLRQTALIVLLAQSGAFVPARAATIGLVSQVFSRVGASDDLARGRSTFMVEMVETAAILNQADDRALVILDEIGRGTSTWDGLSIAWAVLEHLESVNRCRALFATHYHELGALAATLDGVEAATMAVREHCGDVVFLHEVRPGAADRSYGVQVAKLAGLPAAVTARAREVLERLEAGERDAGPRAIVDDLPLFSTPRQTAPPTAGPSRLDTRMAEVLPDTLSPREALDLIYELKAMSQGD
ncbi:MAG: DNA mismatch repair protein MutS [Paracoccaceae bacterium]